MAKKKVELFEENLDKVAGGTGEENMNNGADNNAGDNGGEDNGGDGGDGGNGGNGGNGGTSGPNYNNDNRGGKQMNVQMGKNINSSSGNKM